MPRPLSKRVSEYFLVGEEVGLRAMKRDDLAMYQKWLNDSRVTEFLEMGWKPLSSADLDGVYHEATTDPNSIVMVICEKKRGQPIGTTGLYLIQWPCRRAQFRILIGDPSKYDAGYGTETTRLIVQYGFEVLNLATIYLGVNAENTRAVKSYENAGFTTEGQQRQFIYRNNRYYDCLNMSILAHEYHDRKRR